MTYRDDLDTGQGASLRKDFRKVVLFFRLQIFVFRADFVHLTGELNMSSIQKITNLKGISYRVFIRRKGMGQTCRGYFVPTLQAWINNARNGIKETQFIFRSL
jgi:hypothetical protein